MPRRLTHRIQQGETIHSIATQELGNVGEWYNLVRINHLDFPYIVKTEHQKAQGLMNKDSSGTPDPKNWVTYGDKILLDESATVPQIRTASLKNNQVAKHVYDSTMGMDLQLGFSQSNNRGGNAYGDQVAFLKANSKGNDIGTVEGVRNLYQSLTLRLITARGTLSYHPDYGSLLNYYIGQQIAVNPNDTLVDIDNEIERCIMTDPRVQSCNIVQSHLRNQDFFAIVNVVPVSHYHQFTMYVDSANGGINTGL